MCCHIMPTTVLSDLAVPARAPRSDLFRIVLFYILRSLVQGDGRNGVQGDDRGGNPSDGARSTHCGFSLSIRLIFHCRCHRLVASRVRLRSCIVANCSKRTRR